MGGGLECRCIGRVNGADAASNWHFKLFHKEDARSNNPQVMMAYPKSRNM